MFQYSGGQDAGEDIKDKILEQTKSLVIFSSSGMTPYLCLQNCMAQQAHQVPFSRKDEILIVFIKPAREARGPEGPARWER